MRSYTIGPATSGGLFLRSVVVPAAIAIAFLISGCATTGEIPVSLGEDAATYISPANMDGVQDQVVLPASAESLERTVLKEYRIDVRNEAGETVYSAAESVPRGRWWMRKERRKAIETPELVVWDGRDDSGDFVPDGAYGIALVVTDSKGNSGTVPDRLVIVDNTPPRVSLSVSYLLFTPNGDGRLDEITIFQGESSWEDTWSGVIVPEALIESLPATTTRDDAVSESVREFTWSGVLEDVVWDGTAADGSIVTPGNYTYRVGSTDRAGNTGTFEIAGLTVEPTARPYYVELSRDSFSPNDDGVFDSIELIARPAEDRLSESVTAWELIVVDRFGAPQRTFTSGNDSIASRDGLPAIVFDGIDDAGTLLSDGSYRGILRTFHRGDQVNETASDFFVLDTREPYATTSAPYLLFSPDGDGRRDTLPVSNMVDEELLWRASITLEVPADGVELQPGTTVREEIWEGSTTDFLWDGTDGSGILGPNGVYHYRLHGTDGAGNTTVTAPLRIRLDTRPTPAAVAPGYRRFSPNGDGVYDTLPVRLSFGLEEQLEWWRIVLRDDGGSEIGTIASGQRVPDALTWNGIVEELSGTEPVPDGSYAFVLTAAWEKGNITEDVSGLFSVDTIGPTVSVRATPAIFSPDGDGRNDTVTIAISAVDASPTDKWELRITDPTGQPFRSIGGQGTPPARFQWDGRSDRGELVQSASVYQVTATVQDAVGNSGSGTGNAESDILVIREGDRLRIVLSTIVFAPFTADYRYAVPPENARANLETLDRLAEILQRYPDYTVALEGHAVSVLWAQPERARTEHLEVLIPLSLSRAEAIKAALEERGIDGTRMTTRGYGGSRPVVPHSDVENRWKSRRVEFVLSRR